jgi:hypothetical protein
MWLKFANYFFTIVIFRALIRVQDDPTHALQYTSHTHNTSHTLARELNLNIYTKIKQWVEHTDRTDWKNTEGALRLGNL